MKVTLPRLAWRDVFDVTTVYQLRLDFPFSCFHSVHYIHVMVFKDSFLEFPLGNYLLVDHKSLLIPAPGLLNKCSAENYSPMLLFINRIFSKQILHFIPIILLSGATFGEDSGTAIITLQKKLV